MHRVDTWTRLWGARYVYFTLEGGKGYDTPRTWENDPFGGVCDLVNAQKDELSQSKHMGLTIYTKGNINLGSYGRTMLDVGAKGGTLFCSLNDPFWSLAHPGTFLTSLQP